MRILKVLKNFLILFSYLNSRRKIQTYIIIFLMAVSSFLEVFSISMVVPFITVLFDPLKLNNIYNGIDFITLTKTFGFNNVRFFLTLVFILAFIFSNFFRVSIIYLFHRISRSIAADLNIKIFKHMLFNDYHLTIKENSSYRISAMTEKAELIIGLFFNTLTFFSGLIILIFISILFIFLKPLLTIYVFLSIIFLFFIISKFLNNRLLDLSEIISKKMSKKLIMIQEAFGGLRQIILDKTQKIHLLIFQYEETSLRKAQATAYFLTQVPKYIIEIFGVTIISVISYYLMQNQIVDSIKLITLLGFIGFAAIRLLPVTTNMYQSYNSLLSTAGIVNEFAGFIQKQKKEILINGVSNNINFNEILEFKNVNFSYKNDSNFSIKNINFQVLKGQRVGIVGETGSGKSTIIDIIIGLLEADGDITIDGINLNSSNVLSWQSKISHVPQEIYLMDRSIAQNIAFTIKKNEINQILLMEVIKLAELEDFIKSLRDKENTIIGERGIFISGGQKQRIGLARAFYNQKDILILDEATSALDVDTERKIINNLREKFDNLTIIQISHRLKTLEFTNKIFKFKKDGKLEVIKYVDL